MKARFLEGKGGQGSRVMGYTNQVEKVGEKGQLCSMDHLCIPAYRGWSNMHPVRFPTT